MLSLGIDPGTARVGWGLVRELDDGALQAVDYGVITTAADQSMHARLQRIHAELGKSSPGGGRCALVWKSSSSRVT